MGHKSNTTGMSKSIIDVVFNLRAYLSLGNRVHRNAEEKSIEDQIGEENTTGEQSTEEEEQEN